MGGNYACPKYCFAGKGSVVVLSFSYLRVAKMTRAWQGKARHEGGGGVGGGSCCPESVALFYNLGRPEINYSKHTG